MGNANLVQWLPNSLKENDFWIELMEVLEEEFDLYRQELIDPLGIYYDINNNDNVDDLVDVAIGYGFIPDRSIDDTTSFLQFDVLSIGHRKKFLTTYVGYEYIYKSLDYLGDIFTLYYNGTKLIRAEDDSNIGNIQALLDYSKPYLYLAERNYFEFFSGNAAYDADLDYDTNVDYDSAFFRLATKHIAIEYFLDRILTVDSTEYLMTNDRLNYLLTGANYNRRAIETPHCATQLTIFMDESGFYDNLSGGNDNDSIPDLKLKASIIPSTYGTTTIPDDITKIKVGTGSQGLVGSVGGGSYPSDLASPLYESIISVEDEVYDDTSTTIIQTLVGIDTKLDYDVSLSSTSVVNFVIPFVPIRRLGLTIKYAISGIDYEVKDDGSGNITGTGITSGTINYDTGQLDIAFSSTTDDKVKADIIFNSNYVNTDDTNFIVTEITEVGLFNDLDELIAYATFPPIQYDDNKFHTSYQFVIVK